MTEHTQATPRGHPKANDTTDRENTLGELNAKLHTQKKLNVYEKNNRKRPRHKRATLHRAPT